MLNTIPASTLDKFTTFGDLLRFLRRRAGITQLEFSIAVGYSDSQISRLEQNMRLPDLPTIEARFIPALCLEDEPKAAARLLELAAAVRREDAPALGMCPYKGLDYFDETDADLFVGREMLTEKLVSRILSLSASAQADHSRFFGIVGASGSGKSSLVRAGIVPALRWNKTSANWPIYILTPAMHPLESLADALTRENSSLASTAGLIDDLARDYRTLHLHIRRQLKSTAGSQMLLVIDQFEELFSTCRSEQERQAFIDNLLNAASSKQGGAVIIITLRADFYAHCAKYPALRGCLAAQQEYIGVMNDEEMRRAIEEPARRGRWEFESGLVDLILHDVGHEPGALPLLSHALLETWQRRHGRSLTFSGYISAGGVHGAIAETAEAVFTDQFTPQQQAIARRIFIRLTELGDDTSTGDTRRRASLAELILKPEEQQLTTSVINALVEARLVTTGEDSVQVAHEALIREWPTLRSWLEENRDGLRLHRHLTNAAQDWYTSGQEPDLLFRGARLAQASEWASTHSDEMNAQEYQFLEASVAESQREAAEREEQHARELEAAQKLAQAERQRAEDGIKSSRRLRLRSVLITIISTIAVILAAFAIYTWQGSASQAALSRSRDLAIFAKQANQSGKGDLALAIALEAVDTDHPPIEAVSALREVAQSSGTRAILYNKDSGGIDKPIDRVITSPDNRLALTSGCAMEDSSGMCLQGELTLWDLETQSVLHRWSAHSAAITAIAFTQEGQAIVSGAQDGSLILWNTSGEQVFQLTGHKDRISGIAGYPHSSLVLSASPDGSMILWESKTGSALQHYDTIFPTVNLAAASGKLALVTTHPNGMLMVWSVYKGVPDQIFPYLGEGVDSITVNSDASWALLTGKDTSGAFLRRVDLSSGEMLNQQEFACFPVHVALDPDSTYAIISCQSSIYQMDIPSWTLEQVFIEAPGPVSDITLTEDGRYSLFTTQNGALSLWNLRNDLEYSIQDVSADRLDTGVIGQDGKSILLDDTSMKHFDQPGMWDLTSKQLTKSFYSFNGTTSQRGMDISPEGNFVAVSGVWTNAENPDIPTPVISIWDASSNLLHCQVEDFNKVVSAVAFSPDDEYLAVGTQDLADNTGDLSLWEVDTCQVTHRFNTAEAISSVDFSTDGTHMLTGSASSPHAILWDVATGEEIRRFSNPGNEPISPVLFAAGESGVLGAGLGALYLWDIQSGALTRTYSAQSAFISDAALSPDSRYVLAGTLNGDLILWDFSSAEELRRLNTQLDLSTVLFSPDGKAAYAMAREGKIVTWPIAEKTLAELLTWVRENRYIRPLICAERQQYHIDPQCKP